MTFLLTKNQIISFLDKKKSVVLAKKIPSDLLTPALSLLKIESEYPDFHFLLESVEKGNNKGRYSIIGLMPDLIWKCENSVAYINRNAAKNPNNFEKIAQDPLNSLRQIISESQIEISENIEKISDLILSSPKLENKKFDKNSLNFISNFTQKEYCAAVEKAQEYIKNGDIFQVLPSQRFTSDFAQNCSFSFYRALRSVNPSPFLFYLKFPNFVITGSSPEIMVSKRDKKIIIRPLAGTRKRGLTPAEDAKNATDLLSDEKELAEHLMLIDLGRHDVGRVCKENSVKVTEKMIIEYYSHVMHISSTVEGILRDEFDALDALIAGFPAGTVSGAPKIRAMEIIEELEKHRRSFYAGCVGYFAGNGDMETCIVLRSALIKDNKIHLQAGAGVVFDSNPESEHQECLNKARALMKAAEKVGEYL